jgi:hypothetical protein
MRKRLIWIAPLAVLGMAVFVAIGGEVVRLLWNWLLPTLFGWPQITFWQAVGLLALCRILFGRSGLGRGMRRSGSWRRRDGRWPRMTSEERDEFRRWMRERWAGGRPPEPSSNG